MYTFTHSVYNMDISKEERLVQSGDSFTERDVGKSWRIRAMRLSVIYHLQVIPKKAEPEEKNDANKVNKDIFYGSWKISTDHHDDVNYFPM